jgi:hypothetical protein
LLLSNMRCSAEVPPAAMSSSTERNTLSEAIAACQWCLRSGNGITVLPMQ